MTRPLAKTALVVAILAAVVVPAGLLWPATPVADVALPPALTPLPSAEVPPIAPALTAPLFDARRAPPPAPGEATAKPAVPPPPPAPPPVLVGAVGRPGGGGIALIRDAAGKTVTVATGASVDGWRLLDVHGGSATFLLGDRTETVTLDFKNRVPATAASPTNPPGGAPQDSSPPVAGISATVADAASLTGPRPATSPTMSTSGPR